MMDLLDEMDWVDSVDLVDKVEYGDVFNVDQKLLYYAKHLTRAKGESAGASGSY